MYIKPEIEIFGIDNSVVLLSGSGRTGDILHDANTQKDTIINLYGGDEYHEGDDDLEGAKKRFTDYTDYYGHSII